MDPRSGYSWSLRDIQIRGLQCDEPCEAECECRYEVPSRSGRIFLPSGDVIQADSLVFGESGDWIVASTKLHDIECGAPSIFEYASIVIDRAGHVAHLPVWQAGECDVTCGEDEVFLAICPATPRSEEEMFLVSTISRTFSLKENGSSLEITATDTVDGCGGEGKKRSRATRYRVATRGDRIEVLTLP
jgi:hypothetical protein